MSALKRFGRYKKEEQRATRRIDARENEVLARLADAYKRTKCRFHTDIVETVHDQVIEYSRSKLIDSIDFSADDVTAFCLILSQFEHEHDFSKKAGLFLTALAMRGEADSYVLRIGHLEMIHCLGCRNRDKELILDGSPGDMTGIYMEGGKLTITGNVGNHCGYFMKGGEISVRGNVKYGLGQRMEGGEIRIEGVIERLGSRIDGGRIRQRGELIVDK
jgi:hypothetical protein